MAETAILQPTKPMVPHARGPQKDAAQGQQNGEGAEGGFTALLVAVEEIAALGGQIAVQAPAVPLQAGRQGQSALGQLEGAFQAVRSELNPLSGQVTAPTGEAIVPLGRAANAPQTPRQPQSPLFPATDANGQARGEGQVNQAVQPLDPNHPGAQARGPMNPADQAAARLAEEFRQVQQTQGQGPKLESQIASSPRLEAVLGQQTSGETSNPVVRQVATNLQYVARGEMERVRFDLFPEELGRVQIQLHKSGAVTRLTIVTETAQAFEALQRGAGGLQQSLQQSGFDADDLVFDHREGRGEGRQSEMQERREREERRPYEEQMQEERREVLVRPAGPNDRIVFL